MAPGAAHPSQPTNARPAPPRATVTTRWGPQDANQTRPANHLKTAFHSRAADSADTRPSGCKICMPERQLQQPVSRNLETIDGRGPTPTTFVRNWTNASTTTTRTPPVTIITFSGNAQTLKNRKRLQKRWSHTRTSGGVCSFCKLI